MSKIKLFRRLSENHNIMIIIQCTQDNNWKVAYLNTLKLFPLKRWLLRYFVLTLLGLLVLGVTHQNEREIYLHLFFKLRTHRYVI